MSSKLPYFSQSVFVIRFLENENEIKVKIGLNQKGSWAVKKTKVANLALELLPFVMVLAVGHRSFQARMQHYSYHCCCCCDDDCHCCCGCCCYCWCCWRLSPMVCWPLIWPIVLMRSCHCSSAPADVLSLFSWMHTVEIRSKSTNPSFGPCVESLRHSEHCCKLKERNRFSPFTFKIMISFRMIHFDR